LWFNTFVDLKSCNNIYYCFKSFFF